MADKNETTDATAERPYGLYVEREGDSAFIAEEALPLSLADAVHLALIDQADLDALSTADPTAKGDDADTFKIAKDRLPLDLIAAAELGLIDVDPSKIKPDAGDLLIPRADLPLSIEAAIDAGILDIPKRDAEAAAKAIANTTTQGRCNRCGEQRRLRSFSTRRGAIIGPVGTYCSDCQNVMKRGGIELIPA